MSALAFLSVTRSAFVLVGRTLYWCAIAIYALLLEAIALAMMVGISYPFAVVAFDLVGWKFAERHALVIVSVGVVHVSLAVAFFAWLQTRRPPMSFARMVANGLTELVAQDDYGKLWRIGSDLVVEVANATSEPDGSYRHYFLRVPPEMRTAHAAVAWTFGYQGGHEYAPAIES